MRNQLITVEDKHLVSRRLAEGMSTRQAIRGTAIRSNQTAARLARTQSHKITQIRHDYLELIESYLENSYIERAKYWADMLKATKKIPALGNSRAHDALAHGYIEVPDWNIRYKAMVYLDQLAGMTIRDSPTSVNILQTSISR